MKHQDFHIPAQEVSEAERFSLIYQFYYQPLLLFIFLFGSWWTSKSGVLAMAEWISGASTETEQIALLVSALAMAAQYALWHYAMRLIPRYEAYQAKGMRIPRKVGIDSTRSWARIPRQRGQPFHCSGSLADFGIEAVLIGCVKRVGRAHTLAHAVP